MVKISFEGHANCRISDNINIWIDPFFTGNGLAKNDWRTLDKPDVVLVTHGHGDHLGDAIEICKESGAKLGCIVELAAYCIEQGVPSEQVLNHGIGWNIGGTIEYMGNYFTMHTALHSSTHGVPTSFVIKTPSGFTCYHAGDTGIFSDMQLIGQLHKIDLAMLPIGDVFTMGAKQAALACTLLQTKSVMPIHYATMPIIEQDTKAFETELKAIMPQCELFILEANSSKEYILG